MLMKVRRASDVTTEKPPIIEEVEVKTIEDIIALSEKYEADLILNQYFNENEEYELLVYDDYIE